VKCAPAAKKSKYFFITLILGGYLWFILATLSPKLPSESSPLLFYSSQLQQDLKQTLLCALKRANKSIFIQIYGLSDPEILSLLKKKQAEGVDVTLFYDAKASKQLATFPGSYPIRAKGLMHRKILIVDEAQIFIGTANFTTPSLTT
jgi:phosphatidylserine/phosphatidylglycerophosphate/cardiolipin synthase-like enzyme